MTHETELAFLGGYFAVHGHVLNASLLMRSPCKRMAQRFKDALGGRVENYLPQEQFDWIEDNLQRAKEAARKLKPFSLVKYNELSVFGWDDERHTIAVFLEKLRGENSPAAVTTDVLATTLLDATDDQVDACVAGLFAARGAVLCETREKDLFGEIRIAFAGIPPPLVQLLKGVFGSAAEVDTRDTVRIHDLHRNRLLDILVKHVTLPPQLAAELRRVHENVDPLAPWRVKKDAVRIVCRGINRLAEKRFPQRV